MIPKSVIYPFFNALSISSSFSMNVCLLLTPVKGSLLRGGHCFISFFQSFGLPFFHGKIVQQHNAEGEGEQSDDGKRGNGVSLRVRYLPEKPNYAIRV